MKAVHGNAKSRKSLASIYAIYSILYYYKKTFIIIRMNINSLVVMIIKVYLTFVIDYMEALNYKTIH